MKISTIPTLFFNSISFHFFSKSWEIHLIPYVKSETNEVNKSNAFTSLGPEGNSKPKKDLLPHNSYYWAYEDHILYKTGSPNFTHWEAFKVKECFLHIQISEFTRGTMETHHPEWSNVHPWCRTMDFQSDWPNETDTKSFESSTAYAKVTTLPPLSLVCGDLPDMSVPPTGCQFSNLKKNCQEMERAPIMYLPSVPTKTHLAVLILDSHQLWQQAAASVNS